jgi:putative flippase GtrA
LAGICLAATFNFLLSNRWAWREQSEEPTASAYYA